MYLISAKRLGFMQIPLYKKKEPHALHYLSQYTSFWIAVLSLIAFVAGNMMGQHGWHVFWKSVLGATDDSLIVYTGTVTPIEAIPDYEKWSQYGGSVRDHSYREVPQDLLIALPSYDSQEQSHDHDYEDLQDVYSIGNMGSYATGAEGSGSHPGVDIMVPVGTPVRSIANGIVESVGDNSGGYGKVVVIRHPNVPDPDNQTQTTTLYSVYAHLSAIFVSQGQIVDKAQTIGQSGQTGFATGPHLHFQIDRDQAPWHPYWPFSDSEARTEGMTFVQAVNSGLFQSRGHMYTINPMSYVQANYRPVLVADASGDGSNQQQSSSAVSSVSSSASSAPANSAEVISTRKTLISLLLQRRNDRTESRIARRHFSDRIVASNTQSNVLSVTQEAATDSTTDTESAQESSSSTSSDQTAPATTSIATVQISHDGDFTGRGWESVRITLLTADGSRATNPDIKGTLYPKTAYGDAEFRPSALTADDFTNGIAQIHMLPRGKRTVVIQLQPFTEVSKPMEYQQP